jgi:hypothetical protein
MGKGSAHRAFQVGFKWKRINRIYGQRLTPTCQPRRPSDSALVEAQGQRRLGLPAIDSTPLQGRFLWLLARIRGAKRILEIGTLGGYSTIWLGRALPSGGRLVTLEVDPKHAEVARGNILRAGLWTASWTCGWVRRLKPCLARGRVKWPI